MLEPHSLRECLDDTFKLVVQLEASVRGTLDNLLLKELVSVLQIPSPKVSETCISVSSSSYGTGGDCSTSEGLGVGSSFSTQATSTFQ